MLACGTRNDLWRTICQREWPVSASLVGLKDYRAFAGRMCLEARPVPEPTTLNALSRPYCLHPGRLQEKK